MLLQYKNRFLRYFNKENINYTQGYVDPYEYHSCFITLARLFAIIDYEKNPFWMHVTPVCVAVSAVLASGICLISITDFIKRLQVHLITECGTYLLIMLYKLLIISCTFINKKNYHHLFRALRDDFKYISERGVIYRERFFENHLVTSQACVLAAIFTGATGSGMSLWAIYSMITFVSKNGKLDDEGNPRPMPFPFWLFDYDLNTTPVYEILFLLSIFFTFYHTLTYIFMMQTEIVWVRQITSKADTISWHLQDLLINIHPARSPQEEEHNAQVIKHRMREIMPMHHAMFSLMEDYAAVYRKCLLYEQKLAGPIICMTAYCAAEKFDEGEVQGILLLLCSASVVLVAIPAYLCTFLLEKVQSVSDACWDTPFWNAGSAVRPYLILIMQRSMRQLPIAAAGFEDISLQTYANMMTRAYSCFNMLRQGNF